MCMKTGAGRGLPSCTGGPWPPGGSSHSPPRLFLARQPAAAGNPAPAPVPGALRARRTGTLSVLLQPAGRCCGCSKHVQTPILTGPPQNRDGNPETPLARRCLRGRGRSGPAAAALSRAVSALVPPAAAHGANKTCPGSKRDRPARPPGAAGPAERPPLRSGPSPAPREAAGAAAAASPGRPEGQNRAGPGGCGDAPGCGWLSLR